MQKCETLGQPLLPKLYGALNMWLGDSLRLIPVILSSKFISAYLISENLDFRNNKSYFVKQFYTPVLPSP